MPDPAPRPGLHEELVTVAMEAMAGASTLTERGERAVSALLPLIEKRLLSDEAVEAHNAAYMNPSSGDFTNGGRSRAALRAAVERGARGRP